MSMTVTAPTPRQQAYLSKLRNEVGAEAYAAALTAVIGPLDCYGSRQSGPISRTQVSMLISDLAALAGHETRPRSSSRGKYGRSYRPVYRCTHEDYPCCGCGEDVGR